MSPMALLCAIEQHVHSPLTPVTGRDLTVHKPLLTLTSGAFESLSGLDEGGLGLCVK